MGLESTPENSESLPKITQEDLHGYFAMPFEEQSRKMEEAVEHMSRHNQVLHYVIDQVSQVIPDLQDHTFFRTMAVAIYMFYLQKFGEDMPFVTRKAYTKLEKRLVRGDSSAVLQQIAQTLFDENYDLNDMLIDSLNKKGLGHDIRHVNGAMVVYHLLRQAHLNRQKKAWRRGTN